MLSTLVHAQYGAKRVVLVGDPQQLPATVVSMEAQRRGYGVSLFERLQRGGHAARMLCTQYRMHPAIRAFPSAHFYDGKLRDGEVVRSAARAPAGTTGGPPGFLAIPGGAEMRLAPYAFLNLTDGYQSRGGGGGEHGGGTSRSLRNDAEAKFCVRLLLSLVYASDRWSVGETTASETRALLGSDEATPAGASGGGGSAAAQADGAPATGCGWCCLPESASRGEPCPFGCACGRVVILTPYREQKRALEAELSAVFGPSVWEHAVEVASVDSFQGKEKDLVLYSCVRSATKAGLGFVKDLRRLNVALTRARHALYIIGADQALRQSATWAALIDDAAARGLSRDVTVDAAMRTPPLELLSDMLPASLLDGTPPGGNPRGALQRSVRLVR